MDSQRVWQHVQGCHRSAPKGAVVMRGERDTCWHHWNIRYLQLITIFKLWVGFLLGSPTGDTNYLRAGTMYNSRWLAQNQHNDMTSFGSSLSSNVSWEVLYLQMLWYLVCFVVSVFTLQGHFLFVFYSSLKYYFPITVSPPSTPSSPPHFPLSQIYSTSISLQKKAGPLGISSRHYMRSYNKAYKGWNRQASRSKRVPGAGKRVRDIHSPTIRNSTRLWSYTTITYIQRT